MSEPTPAQRLSAIHIPKTNQAGTLCRPKTPPRNPRLPIHQTSDPSPIDDRDRQADHEAGAAEHQADERERELDARTRRAGSRGP